MHRSANLRIRNESIWNDVVYRKHTLKRAAHDHGLAATTVAIILRRAAVKKGLVNRVGAVRGVEFLRELVTKGHHYLTVSDFSVWD